MDLHQLKNCQIRYLLCISLETNNKHLLDETESNIQFIVSGQGNTGRSEAEPNVILYRRNQLDVGQGQVQ